MWEGQGWRTNTAVCDQGLIIEAVLNSIGKELVFKVLLLTSQKKPPTKTQKSMNMRKIIRQTPNWLMFGSVTHAEDLAA